MNAPQVVAQLVGCKHYRGAYHRAGKLTPGEGVVISRNPDNSHDFNAVQVHSPEGRMLGHLDGLSAAQIAPFMDAGIIYVATVVEPFKTKRHNGMIGYKRGSCLIRCTPLPPLRGKKITSILIDSLLELTK